MRAGLLAVAFACLASGAPASFAATTGDAVITGVNVVDVRSGQIRTGVDVRIHAGKIAGIGGRQPLSPGTRTIAGAGRYLIPGLADMHVHLNGLHLLKADLANGVTRVRIMWGSPPAFDVRERVERGTLAGPRVTTAGRLLDGTPGSWFPVSMPVRTPEDCKAAVEEALHVKADFVKVYTFLPRHLYLAIVEAARGRIPVAGHVPFDVPAAEASDLGQRSLEHWYGIAESCCPPEAQARIRAARQKAMAVDCAAANAAATTSTREWELWQAAREQAGDAREPARQQTEILEAAAHLHACEQANKDHADHVHAAYRAASGLDAEICKAYDTAAARAFYNKLVKNDTYVVPTHHLEGIVHKRYSSHSARLIREMVLAGVPLMAGSDEPNAGLQAGRCLHQELKALWDAVRGGLPDSQAAAAVLRMATLNPARFVGREETEGTVDVGKEANLVLLEGNPLEAIANTQRITGVCVRGEWLDRAQLDQLQTEANQRK